MTVLIVLALLPHIVERGNMSAKADTYLLWGALLAGLGGVKGHAYGSLSTAKYLNSHSWRCPDNYSLYETLGIASFVLRG